MFKSFKDVLCRIHEIQRFALERSIYSQAHDFNENLERITVPVPMKRLIKKVKKKLLIEAEVKRLAKVRRGHTDKVIISCKTKELNHHLNQTYAKFHEVPLASKGWRHYKSSSDYFTINMFKPNPVVKWKQDCTPSFEDYELDERLVKYLRDQGIEEPTLIQDACIPSVLKRQNTLCCGQTGSGKTLGYLLPVFQMLLKDSEIPDLSRDVPPNSPRSIILVPSRELASQISEIAIEIGELLGLKVRSFLGGHKTKKLILNPEFEFDIDMVISTPGVFRKLTSSTIYKLDFVRYVIIDEVDTMLDDSFCEDTSTIVKKIRISDDAVITDDVLGAQLILIGATLPRNVDNVVSNIIHLDSLVNVTPDNVLHHIMPHVAQKFIRIRPGMKPAKLLYTINKFYKNQQPTIVFTSDSNTCHWVHKFLEDNSVQNVALHGNMSNRERSGRFEAFSAGAVSVLTSTDLGSRGLDTIGVQHVINYDFPSYLSDYIHRCGRVGRVGSSVSGLVTNFVSNAWEIDLVQQIEFACRKMMPLQKVDANIRRKIDNRMQNCIQR